MKLPLWRVLERKIVRSLDAVFISLAQGYAKASGKPGMIMTTSGPGTTNLITPFQDALNDTVPMIAFTGLFALLWCVQFRENTDTVWQPNGTCLSLCRPSSDNRYGYVCFSRVPHY